ncbi:hypothetical protein DICPUDRAFT_84213 [Dictyostelium purpureum]|uniref:Uncharacterized protein n=1 Tax=Dictyostelium purpureum TaxID=5786 RepID=F1A1X7_DICPU|nr:uncharacterized protein DICPUDRAFT_84213 [Dictyostelium purpureum]EGC29803.1 hypothetical protein DICPUDRAFT_84213 [Dictyostelium purpureum]|eukprot:XP_003293668.1 hypothetical protein DICPUDRAFT_84213 [Dictyostelium purpureum]
MDFVFIFFVAVISFLLGFIYNSVAKYVQLKNQLQAKKELEKDQLFKISNLKHQIKKFDLEKKIQHDQLSIQSKKQEIVDQINKSEHVKLNNTIDDQSNEIGQLFSLINQQKQSIHAHGIKQGKLVEERDSLKVKLEDQIIKSNELQEKILEKERIIQMVEKKIEVEQQVLLQLSIENNEELEKLNFKEGQLEENNMNIREQDPFDREPIDMDANSEISDIDSNSN